MKSLRGRVEANTLIYSLQNGFGNTDIMRSYFSPKQIVAGVVSWGASNLGSGKFRLTSTGDFVLGFENGKNCDNAQLLEARRLLKVWKPTIITPNILGYRWAKLIVNSVIASYGGLLGTSVGEMFRDSVVSNLMLDLGDEGIRVGDAQNIQLEKVAGLNIRNFFYTPQSKDGFLKRFIRTRIVRLMQRVAARRHGEIQSSLLRDLNRGRLTEVDFLNGYIEKKGKEFNIETPINSFLVKAIHEIEKGKRKTGLDNLPELLDAAKYSREIAMTQQKTV